MYTHSEETQQVSLLAEHRMQQTNNYRMMHSCNWWSVLVRKGRTGQKVVPTKKRFSFASGKNPRECDHLEQGVDKEKGKRDSERDILKSTACSREKKIRRTHIQSGHSVEDREITWTVPKGG